MVIRYFFVFILFFLIPVAAFARIELIKSVDSDAVYFLDESDVRHVFPDLKTYRSWYGDSFSDVVQFSSEMIAQYPLGANITMRPGSLIKIPSAQQVYAVEPGGLLREIVTEDVARSIYGEDWASRVVDVSESFWQNYSVGKPIELSHQVPDGILYRIDNEAPYYYKYRDAIQPFSSEEAIFANNLSPSLAIEQPQAFFARARPIEEREKKVFDPAYELVALGSDCKNTDLKIGVVFLTAGEPDPDDLLNIEIMMENFPRVWHSSTGGLSTLSFVDEVDLQRKDIYNWTASIEDGSFLINIAETSFSYFDEHPDDVDFLIYINDFFDFPDALARFSPVTNDFRGNNKMTMRRGNQFGSTGKLKGIVDLGIIDTYYVDGVFAPESFYNIILHELGHMWTAEARFRDSEGNLSTDLLKDDLLHWSDTVEFVSPDGSFGWEHVGGGIYRDMDTVYDLSNIKGFAPIDLYLMGLYPASAVGEIGYLEINEIDKVNNTARAERKVVTIDQILNAHGEFSCRVD